MIQLGLDDLASPPAARTTDPFTSQRAALRGQRGRSKRAVLAVLAGRACATDEQLADALPHLPRGSASKRRLDLCRLGLVEEARLHGEVLTTTTRSGSPALLWMLTPAGRLLARSLEDDGQPTTRAPRVTVEVEDLETVIRLIDQQQGNTAIELLRSLIRS